MSHDAFAFAPRLQYGQEVPAFAMAFERERHLFVSVIAEPAIKFLKDGPVGFHHRCPCGIDYFCIFRHHHFQHLTESPVRFIFLFQQGIALL